MRVIVREMLGRTDPVPPRIRWLAVLLPVSWSASTSPALTFAMKLRVKGINSIEVELRMTDDWLPGISAPFNVTRTDTFVPVARLVVACALYWIK